MPLHEFLLPHNNRNGFTFVEILIVTAAIGLLVVLAVPEYRKHHHNIEQAVIDISEISVAITKYQLSNSRLPEDLSELGIKNMVDPWGIPYQYHAHNSSTPEQQRKDRNLRPVNSDYDLYSVGKNGNSASALSESVSHDDIIRANNGKWIGIVSKY